MHDGGVPVSSQAVPTRARTEQLEALLARNPVEGPAGGAEGRGATWDEIVSSVQASEAELRDGLRRAGALGRGGRWMVLSATYLSDLQHALLLVVLENGWPADAVPVREAVAGVEEGAAWHVTHALRLLCADGAGPTGAEGETVALDPARLNRSRVQRLFGAHTGSADRVRGAPPSLPVHAVTLASPPNPRRSRRRKSLPQRGAACFRTGWRPTRACWR